MGKKYVSKPNKLEEFLKFNPPGPLRNKYLPHIQILNGNYTPMASMTTLTGISAIEITRNTNNNKTTFKFTHTDNRVINHTLDNTEPEIVLFCKALDYYDTQYNQV